MAGAEVAFKQSIDLHPAPAVGTNLDNLSRQMDRAQDAMACYNRAIEAARSVQKKRRLFATILGIDRFAPFDEIGLIGAAHKPHTSK